MKSEWPYVEGKHSAEKEDHIRLKGIAVEFLLGLGFEIDEIEEEKYLPKNGGRGRGVQTDVYACNGPQEIFVECETQFGGTPRDLSGGGKVPLRDGNPVFLVAPDGIYVVGREMVELEHRYRDETSTRSCIGYAYVADHPSRGELA